ncbi:MAG: hypothetical protein EBR82_71860, partial [Caulobacteraceae bacterium]|nr:hypothetical protein [Caulobacteraceae bacterium]
MPIHVVQAPNGKKYKFEAPQGATQDDIFGYAKHLMLQDDYAEAKKKYDDLNVAPEPTAEAPIQKQSPLRQVADVPIGIARGAAQGIRMIADAFGPDNVVSQA